MARNTRKPRRYPSMRFVRARATALNAAMPCRVIAMSLGSMVATAWAQAFLDEIKRLVLINTSASLCADAGTLARIGMADAHAHRDDMDATRAMRANDPHADV